MNKFLLGAFILLLGSCSQSNHTQETKDSSAKTNPSNTKQEKVQAQELNSFAKSKIDVKTFPAEENTFGYEIWIDGKKTIVQNTIPSMTGNKGFSSEAKALKVAEFVVSKIKRNQMPPSVTSKELDSLGVLK